MFCLFSAALNREISFLETSSTIKLRQTDCNTHILFDSFIFKINNFLIVYIDIQLASEGIIF